MTPQQQETTEHLYWAMLMDLESHTRQGDCLGKNLVEAAYKHWNNIHPSDPVMKPRWIK